MPAQPDHEIDPTVAFWQAVAEPASQKDVKVGDVIAHEIVHDGEVMKRRTVRVIDIVEDTAGRHAHLEEIDTDEEPDIVLVTPL